MEHEGHFDGELSRRDFFRLLGASAALAGVGGCAQEPETRIVPFDRTPTNATPDRAKYYATSMLFDGLATGLLAKSFDGRPVKIDGHPEHPASVGGTGIHHQASVLQLYDPQRARGTLLHGESRPYEDWLSDFTMSAGRGEGLRLLLEPTSSPLIGAMLERVRSKYPESRVFFHSPFGHARQTAGLMRLTGQALQPRYAFERAAVIVCLDADVLDATTYPPRYARDFADGRRSADRSMNRLYAIESTHSITGATADHRFAVRPSEVRDIAEQLLAAVRPGLPDVAVSRPWVKVIAKDLTASGPKAVVVAGLGQAAEVHALAHAINAALGSQCVSYAPSPILEAGQPSHDVDELVKELDRGLVQTLMILDGNPVYTGKSDVDWAGLISRVPRTLYSGLYFNETARRCQWFVPATHFLESWGDGRAYDGTVSFVQPLIRPLYRGKAVSELLAAFADSVDPDSHVLLREYWQSRPEISGSWESNVQRGFLPGTGTPAVSAAVDWAAVASVIRARAQRLDARYEIQLRRAPAVDDGRFANTSWLQELPDPMTRQTWGNAALLSPATAATLGIETGKHLRLSRGERSLLVPALVLPGHADGAVTVSVGYGRDADGAEEVAAGVGVNAYRLWTSDIPNGIGTVDVAVADGSETLAITQIEADTEHRPIALSTTLREHLEHPRVRESDEPVVSLFPPFEQHGNQWGMAIDLSVCTGCAACVVACQAENNIPVVGKENALKGRVMHWIRVDRYFEQERVERQPMLCQHCEKAPCEYVCPVNATTHSPDGINEMTYNRCVGTRFCSNNCPYKVRRFNWFDFNLHKPPVLRMLENPDVTVRARGVMEKCTYCVQRVRETEIRAQKERRPIRDLEILTACQQACPTRAIVFGDIADSKTAVARQMANPRTYAVLEELGTRPRTRYLARVRNPHPELG